MTEIIVNSSGVDPDSLNWLMKAETGYFIQQQMNRSGAHTHNHAASDAFALEIIDAAKADMRKAWELMEKHVAESI